MSLLSRFALLCLLAGCAHSNRADGTAPCPEQRAPGAFEMKLYQLVILRRGPAWTAERTPEAEEASRGHMANIERLTKLGKLVVAGPFEVPPDAAKDAPAGLYIFDVASRDEAAALTQSDPAVQAGRFTAEILPWHGPSGLTYGK